MIAKFLTFFGLVAVVAANVIPVGHVGKVVLAEPEAPAQYEYTYSVQDSQTGDSKQQHESRSGDVVHGSYSLLQPDGLTRIVDYTSDDHQGFNAVVRYEGSAIQQAPAKIAYAPAPIAKVTYAPAPITKIAYAPAPITKVAYAQPNLAYAQGPIAYAAPAPVTYATAPITKLAYAANPVTKVGYTENLGRVTFSSPIISYQH